MASEPKIVITGTCLANKIGEIIGYFMPNAKLVQIYVHEVAGNPDGIDRLKAELADADYWIYLDQSAFYNFVGTAIATERAIRYPIVTFSAFHPDLIYACDDVGKRVMGVAQDCQSAIALWAYSKKLSIDETVAKFTTEIFQRLGYMDYWEDSVLSMKADFENCGLDFKTYYTRVKRHGTFMHTINHPTPIGIIELVRLMLPKIGYKGDIYEPIERYIQDNLLELVWPVYPGVGERLGIKPLLLWRIHKERLNLRTFIERSFAAYDAAGLTSMSSPRFEGPLYDSVLGGK